MFRRECRRIERGGNRAQALDTLYYNLTTLVTVFYQMVIYLYGLDRVSMDYPDHDLLFNHQNLYNWSLCVVLPSKLYSSMLAI